ncbi:hypothetical protein Sjap_018841 [Stephania japonica]|uniref:Uncharacterized protein n=1 Tax=Stephania japonica TaxID=461633 RepID=A0AAP0I8N5_9MAGN
MGLHQSLGHHHRRSTYNNGLMTGCVPTTSCVAVHDQYSRISVCNTTSSRSGNCCRLRNLIRRFVRESKSFYCTSKRLTFQYDAVSYSQNFDEGRRDDEFTRRSFVFNLQGSSGKSMS